MLDVLFPAVLVALGGGVIVTFAYCRAYRALALLAAILGLWALADLTGRPAFAVAQGFVLGALALGVALDWRREPRRRFSQPPILGDRHRWHIAEARGENGDGLGYRARCRCGFVTRRYDDPMRAAIDADRHDRFYPGRR